MKKMILGMFLIAACSTRLLASEVPLKGTHYAPQAKITLAQARTLALKAEPGTIIAQELEKEKGGLRYSFDVKIHSVVREVGIDATTGKVLEDAIDDGK